MAVDGSASRSRLCTPLLLEIPGLHFVSFLQNFVNNDCCKHITIVHDTTLIYVMSDTKYDTNMEPKWLSLVLISKRPDFRGFNNQNKGQRGSRHTLRAIPQQWSTKILRKSGFRPSTPERLEMLQTNRVAATWGCGMLHRRPGLLAPSLLPTKTSWY